MCMQEEDILEGFVDTVKIHVTYFFEEQDDQCEQQLYS